MWGWQGTKQLCMYVCKQDGDGKMSAVQICRVVHATLLYVVELRLVLPGNTMVKIGQLSTLFWKFCSLQRLIQY